MKTINTTELNPKVKEERQKEFMHSLSKTWKIISKTADIILTVLSLCFLTYYVKSLLDGLADDLDIFSKIKYVARHLATVFVIGLGIFNFTNYLIIGTTWLFKKIRHLFKHYRGK